MALSLKSPFMRTAIIAPKKTTPKRLSLPVRVKVECRKKGFHPTLYEDSKVYCDGELVLVTSGSQKEYTVDTWSGNHPFYLGQSMDYDDDLYFYGEEDDEELADDEDEELKKK